MPWDGASANAIMMARMSDLITGISTAALDYAEAWEGQCVTGWERAVAVIDELVIDANDVTDMLQDILGREESGIGHAVTDTELAMAQDHRETLAMRLFVVRRAMQ